MRWIFAVMSVLILIPIKSASADLSDTYYVASASSLGLVAAQGDGSADLFQVSFAAGTFELGLAVIGNQIKLMDYSIGGTGASYDATTGADLGGRFTNTAGTTYDGTTNGTNIFSVGGGDVHMFDTDWGNGVVSFNATANSGGLLGTTLVGIAYASDTDTLWVSDHQGSNVVEFDLAGNMLSSIDIGIGDNTALAFEASSGLLWTAGTDRFDGNFFGYDRAGVLQDTVTINSQIGQNVIGGEFAFSTSVPEPSSTVIFLVGIALLGTRNRIRGA